VSTTFRILGFPITVGVGLPLFLAFMGYISDFTEVEIVMWVVAGCVAVLLHELGHALAFRHYGLESTIQFWSLGGLTIPTDQAAAVRLRDGQMLLVALAGPSVGLALGVAGLGIEAAVAGQSNGIVFAASIWTFVNLGWGIFNLLPIAGLDGGQILHHFLLAALGRRGRPVAFAASIVASALVAVLAFSAGYIFVALIAVIFGVANPSIYQALFDELFPERARRRLQREAEENARFEQALRYQQQTRLEPPPDFDDSPGPAWPDEHKPPPPRPWA
jgi:stage IV sporulation protein FB